MSQQRTPPGATITAAPPQRPRISSRTDRGPADPINRPELAPDGDPAALAERHLVGAMLHSDAATARKALAWVPPADLADPQLRQIAQAIANLAADGLDPQPALVVPRMVRDGLLPGQLGGLANGMVIDLLTQVPLPQSWPYFAATVADRAMRRSLTEAARRLAQAAETSDLATCVGLLEQAHSDAQARLARVGGGPR